MSEAIHLLPGAVDGAIAALRSLLGEDRVVTDRARGNRRLPQTQNVPT